MPAVSPSQRRLMCMALAVKKGDLPESKLNPKYRKGVMATARNMSMEDLEDYCHSEVKK